mgnify:CR=1 FL=1
MEFLYKDITETILKSFFEVYKTLGYGFLEKVYHNALIHELQKNGLYVEKECKIDVMYKGIIVGEYYADLIVEKKIILEIKTAEIIVKQFEYQLMNYLRATKYELGMILNFGKKPEFSRKIYSNNSEQ